MTLNRLISMVLNTALRRLVRLGINRGFGLPGKGGGAERRGKAAGAAAGGTAAGQKQAQDARALAKRARQAARITRRFGR